jgi:hypothetical protein
MRNSSLYSRDNTRLPSADSAASHRRPSLAVILSRGPLFEGVLARRTTPRAWLLRTLFSKSGSISGSGSKWQAQSAGSSDFDPDPDFDNGKSPTSIQHDLHGPVIRSASEESRAPANLAVERSFAGAQDDGRFEVIAPKLRRTSPLIPLQRGNCPQLGFSFHASRGVRKRRPEYNGLATQSVAQHSPFEGGSRGMFFCPLPPAMFSTGELDYPSFADSIARGVAP